MLSAIGEGARPTDVALAARLFDAAECHERSARRRAPLRVIVIGEFNAGKTSLINALLGEALLPTSVVTNTMLITVIRFAARPRMAIEGVDRRRVPIDAHALHSPPPAAHRLHVGAPLAALKRMELIDTPGLASGNVASERQTLSACSRADVIVFCTPAMQAWKASEQAVWLGLPERVRRKGILAVTFSDAIASAGDATRLIRRLVAEAGPHFREVVMAPGRPGARA